MCRSKPLITDLNKQDNCLNSTQVLTSIFLTISHSPEFEAVLAYSTDNGISIKISLFLSRGGGWSFGGVFPQKGDGMCLCGCG
jgi:hypothetical protein